MPSVSTSKILKRVLVLLDHFRALAIRANKRHEHQLQYQGYILQAHFLKCG